MADKKISQLTTLSELSGDEQFPVAKDGANYKVSVEDLQKKISGGGGSGTPSTPIQTKDIADNAVTSPKLSEDVRQSLAAAAGAVRYDAAQGLTTEQKEQARTNIAAMANTPSGDPMHYIYETAGAEWIPYADISTDGLESWQINTLNRAQAQADGGVWWHNDIFVTVAQNRINYVLTIGKYEAYTDSNNNYLAYAVITTNYKSSARLNIPTEANSLGFGCHCRALRLPSSFPILSGTRLCASTPYLRRVLGVLDLSNVRNSADLNNFFKGSPIQDVEIKGLRVNLNLSTNENPSVASVAYMITNAGTATLTITLASAVYIAAMEDTAVQAALEAKPNVTLANAGATDSEN